MAKTNRRSKKGITRTVIVPKWEKDLRAAIKGVKREVSNALRGAVLLIALYAIMLVLTKVWGGG